VQVRRTALLQLAGSVLLLSSAWPITKQAIGAGVSPLWFGAGRAGFSGLAVFVALGLTGRLRIPGRQDFPALFGWGLLSLAAFFAFTHAAVAFIEAGRTAILANVTTIWIAPISLIFLHERVPARRWIAGALGIAGVVVLIGPWAIDWARPGVLLGHGYLLGASFCFAAAMAIVRRYPPGLPMFQVLPWCFLVAAVLLIPFAALHGPPGVWTGPSWLAMAYIGLLAGPVGTWCVMEASVRLPAMVASVGLLMTPAAGLMLSTWWLAEPLGWDLLFGSALILGGVLAAAWPERR
jgi:drug/metabolite transporter (DMT)-like permease